MFAGAGAEPERAAVCVCAAALSVAAPLMAASHYGIPSFPIVKFVIYHVTAWSPLKRHTSLRLSSSLRPPPMVSEGVARDGDGVLPTFTDLDGCLFVSAGTHPLVPPVPLYMYTYACMHPLCLHCMSAATYSEKLIKYI